MTRLHHRYGVSGIIFHYFRSEERRQFHVTEIQQTRLEFCLTLIGHLLALTSPVVDSQVMHLNYLSF